MRMGALVEIPSAALTADALSAVPGVSRVTAASMPPPLAESGIELRTTMELAWFTEVNSTNWPELFRRTDWRPEDSVAKLVCPKVRNGSAVSSVPLWLAASAS